MYTIVRLLCCGLDSDRTGSLLRTNPCGLPRIDILVALTLPQQIREFKAEAVAMKLLFLHVKDASTAATKKVGKLKDGCRKSRSGSTFRENLLRPED
jgi:hypothetical protein